MLTKIKVVIGGAILVFAGSLLDGLLTQDYSALPYGAGTLVVAGLGYLVKEGIPSLTEYLVKKGYHVWTEKQPDA